MGIALMKLEIAMMAIAVVSTMHIFYEHQILIGCYIDTNRAILDPFTIHKNSTQEKIHQLPSVLLIGAQKSWTSAIAGWLFRGGLRRPRVFAGEPKYFLKEVHFFDIHDRFEKGVEFYGNRFKDVSGSALDATPDTFQHADRVKSIYESAGGNQSETVKLIVILRDPVARELSMYNHMSFEYRKARPPQPTEWYYEVARKDGSILSFDEFVETVTMRTLNVGNCDGLYAMHLQKWFHHFSRQQILVLSYDEFSRDEQKVRERIQGFLGYTIPGRIKMENEQENPQKVRRPSAKIREKLRNIFTPQNEELYQLLDDMPGPPMEERPFPRFD